MAPNSIPARDTRPHAPHRRAHCLSFDLQSFPLTAKIELLHTLESGDQDVRPDFDCLLDSRLRGNERNRPPGPGLRLPL